MASSPKLTEIQLVRYPSINECLASFFRCSVDQIPMGGFWEWQEADGSKHKMKQAEALSLIKKRSVWGWVEGKRIIHFYARKNASMSQLVRMLAHEIGHTQKPYHRTIAEEMKANKYGLVAMTAFEIAQRIKNHDKEIHGKY